jgi:hypothetical protein
MSHHGYVFSYLLVYAKSSGFTYILYMTSHGEGFSVIFNVCSLSIKFLKFRQSVKHLLLLNLVLTKENLVWVCAA